MRQLLVILMALLVATLPTALGKEDGEKDADDRPETGKREVKIETSGEHAVIKLEAKGEGAKDELKIDYHVKEGDMKVEFKSDSAASETKNELRVKFRELIEYVDKNGNGAYDKNVDEVASSYRVDDHMHWALTGPEDVTKNGVAGKKLVGRGELPDGGTLTFVLYVYGDFATVNGTTLKPSEVKIDILIDDFPYAKSDSALALLVKVERKAEAHIEGQEEAVKTTAGGYTTYFTWADTALVDGADKPVTSAPLAKDEEGGNSHKLYLNYPRGAHINHDPVLGVASAASTPAASTPAPGLLLVGGAFAAVAVIAAVARRN